MAKLRDEIEVLKANAANAEAPVSEANPTVVSSPHLVAAPSSVPTCEVCGMNRVSA